LIGFIPRSLRRHLPESAGLTAFVNNSGWLLFDKIVRMVLGVIVGAWVARYLGPAQYGQLAYALSFVAVFTAVANFGADGITVRDLALKAGEAPQILGTAFIVRASAGVVCLIVAVGIALLSSGHDGLQVWLIAIIGGTLILQAGDAVDLWFQSRSQSKRTVISKLIAYSVTNSAKVVLILMHAPLAAFALVLLLDAVAAALALWVAYRRYPAAGPWRSSRSRSWELVREASPFMIGGVAVVIYLRVDQLLVRQLMGEHELGVYAAAVWILQVWQIVPTILSTSLGPYIARRKSLDEHLYRKTLILVFRLFFYTGVMSAIATLILAPLIIGIMYGPAYRGAVPVLQICALTLPVFFLGMAHNLWLINEGKYMVRVYGAIAAGIWTVAVIFALAPRYGVLSACFAAVSSQLIASFLINAVFDREAFKMQARAILFTNG
jgi:O-antigen/teichoic acid export membrane protein